MTKWLILPVNGFSSALAPSKRGLGRWISVGISLVFSRFPISVGIKTLFRESHRLELSSYNEVPQKTTASATLI